MYKPTEDIQTSFIEDRMFSANEQAKKAVIGSKAKLFGDVIFPNIDEEKFRPLFSDIISRPNISIRRYIVALALITEYGFSVPVFIELLRSGSLTLQYALRTTQFEKQPLSESSLRRFKRRVDAYNEEHGCDLIKDEVRRISRMMALDMRLLGNCGGSGDGEDPNGVILSRMDSMEIEMRAKTMTRLEIIYTTTAIMIRYLVSKDYAELIPEELYHYMKDGDKNATLYYRVSADKKAGVQESRVADAVHEMELLQKALLDNFKPAFLEKVDEYLVFQRVLEEQSVPGEDGSRIPRDKKDISPSSVQNPFDTSATYRKKRGMHHGFVLNLVEAIDGKGNGVIMDAELEPNTASGIQMEAKYLESLPDNGPRQVMIGDGAYNSKEIEDLAAKKNVEVVTTSLTGKEPDLHYAGFILDDGEREVITCPGGCQPSKGGGYNEETGQITAVFDINTCKGCPFKSRCKVRLNAKEGTSTVKLTDRQVRRARQAERLSSEEARRYAKLRNGVEGIMSVMRRKYRLDDLQVFGLEHSKPLVWLSILAYNANKYGKYLSAKEQSVAA